MKRGIRTIDGDVIALDTFQIGDPIITVNVEITTSEFRKDLDLWIDFFNHVWYFGHIKEDKEKELFGIIVSQDFSQ